MKSDATIRERAPSEIGEELKSLKRRGCAVLTTGKVPPDATVEATRRQLGSPDEDRVRIVALTGSTDRNVAARLPGDVSPDDPDVYVLEGPRARDAAITAPGADVVAPDPRTDLERLSCGVARSVRTYARPDADLDAGQLRLVVDSLKPLLDDHGIEQIEAFIWETATLVRSISGMAYYHLPIDDDHEIVTTLMETGYLDARVELDHQAGSDLQRWHVPGYEETPWLEL